MNLESREEDEGDLNTSNEKDKQRPKKIEKTRKQSLKKIRLNLVRARETNEVPI